MKANDISVETPRPDSRSQKVTLGKIVDECARLFAERGYYNTSMDDIAQAVGILKGSLYHHVTGKEEMLDLVLSDTVVGLLQRTQEVADSDLPAPQRFEEMVRIMVRNTTEISREGTVVFATEHRRLPAKIQVKYEELLRAHRDLFRRVIEEVVAVRGRVDIDVALAVTSIISLTTMMSVWYRPAGRLHLDAIEDEIVRQATRLIGSD